MYGKRRPLACYSDMQVTNWLFTDASVIFLLGKHDFTRPAGLNEHAIRAYIELDVVPAFLGRGDEVWPHSSSANILSFAL